MIAKPKLVATLVMGAAMVFAANAIQAADCSEVASKVGKLYAAKASKDNAAYSTIKTGNWLWGKSSSGFFFGKQMGNICRYR